MIAQAVESAIEEESKHVEEWKRKHALKESRLEEELDR